VTIGQFLEDVELRTHSSPPNWIFIVAAVVAASDKGNQGANPTVQLNVCEISNLRKQGLKGDLLARIASRFFFRLDVYFLLAS
jgi:hypothetical protein